MRLTFDQLDDIKKKLKINTLWSWSRVSSWHTSHYVWFLNYVKHIKPSNDNSIYGTLGSNAHSILEKYYGGQIDYDNMIEEWNDSWYVNREIVQLKFNRSDIDKDKLLALKYNLDVKDFFQTHQPLDKDKVELEKLVLIKVRDDIYMQGYIDIYVKEDDGSVMIGDWKTSTIYTGNKREEALGQLVIYAMGIHQRLGISYDKIKVGWNFIKYVKLIYTQNNGKIKERIIERYQLGDKMKSVIQTIMKRLGYSEEDVEKYVVDMINNNSINNLPDDVKAEFTLEDAWVKTDMTQELADKWCDYVVDTVDNIEDKIDKYNINKDDHVFYDDDVTLKKNDYFLANLCGYSLEQNRCYKDYLDKQEALKNNVLAIIGGDIPDNKNIKQDDDEAWLNDLLGSI